MQWKWLRRIVRRKTNPIPHDIARSNQRKLSYVYVFFAWNAFGLVLYQVFKGKASWADYHGLPREEGTPAQQYARMLKIPKAKVIRISGMETEEYDISNDEEIRDEA